MTYLVKKGNKYGAKSTAYNGSVYHSKFEATRAQELDLMETAKQVKDIRRQVKISFDICSTCHKLCSIRCDEHDNEKVRHLTNYYIDFVYHDVLEDVEVYEEVKGMEQDLWRLKWKMLELLYGNDETKKLIVIK